METASLPIAPRASRAWAAAVDFSVWLLIFALYSTVFSHPVQKPDGNQVAEITGLPALGLVGLWFLVFVVPEGLNGQTLGKTLFKLRVCRLDGSRISFRQALVRRLLDTLDFWTAWGLVGFVLMGYRPLRQRIGDKAAKTVVVRTLA